MNKNCKYCLLDKNIDQFRKNRLKCKECEKEDGRKYRKSEIGKEKSKNWNDKNKEKYKELNSNWTKQNREKINKKFKDRYHNDPIFKLQKLIRRRISLVINKDQSTDKYTGCSTYDLKEWFEFCFIDNFSFENHGDIWHIDHVIPIEKFDLNNSKEKELCFNWRNLMPFSSKKNLIKNKNIDQEQIKIHMKNLQLYHKKNNIIFPKEYQELYAKHFIMTGKSLEL